MPGKMNINDPENVSCPCSNFSFKYIKIINPTLAKVVGYHFPCDMKPCVIANAANEKENPINPHSNSSPFAKAIPANGNIANKNGIRKQ